MADNRSKLALLKHRQKHTKQGDQGKRPQRVSKAKAQRPTRRSARLNPESGDHTRPQYPLTAKKTTNRSTTPQPKSCKQSREAEELPANITVVPCPKRPRASPANFTDTRPADREAEFAIEARINPIDYWRREHVWPKEYFEPDTMSDLLARKRSMPSRGVSSTTFNDQSPREKSASYHGSRYKLSLQAKGSFMAESDLGITEKSKDMYLALLQAVQTVPTESLFRDDIFRRTCRNIQTGNEARIVQDIARLIVPSAETLATFGARTLGFLAESVNEGWNNSIPLTRTRPQPDYSVGFKLEAFSEEQLKKLAPFIGNNFDGDQSFFMATDYMCFPFLTSEVKCSSASLDIANRQNAHSMTLAVRAIVGLFRLAKREEEIHREILAFSVSHNHQSVQIFGHYPIIKGNDEDPTFYRHPIRAFDITDLDGKDKWTTYQFTKNVYEMWMPMHLDRIRSVIDELPSNFDFEVPLLSES